MPPEASERLADGAPYLLQVVADISDLKARVAQVERSVPELAARLDGRFAALEGTMARQGDHLAQQDQAADRARLEGKSQWGTIQQKLDALDAAEAGRARTAQEAEQRAAVRHHQNAARLRQTVAGVAVFVAAQAWSLVAGWPLHWRMVALGGGAALVLLWALADYVLARARPPRHGAP